VPELADLDTVKAHLRVEHDEEDALIGVYLQAASAHVRRYYRVDDPAPADLVAAVLLMVGDLYANRETVGPGVSAITPSLTVSNLLAPFRLWGF
jgi:hypothetical protein